MAVHLNMAQFRHDLGRVWSSWLVGVLLRCWHGCWLGHTQLVWAPLWTGDVRCAWVGAMAH